MFIISSLLKEIGWARKGGRQPSHSPFSESSARLKNLEGEEVARKNPTNTNPHFHWRAFFTISDWFCSIFKTRNWCDRFGQSNLKTWSRSLYYPALPVSHVIMVLSPHWLQWEHTRQKVHFPRSSLVAGKSTPRQGYLTEYNFQAGSFLPDTLMSSMSAASRNLTGGRSRGEAPII